MAEDHSQHMDVNGRQELGWLVPRVLEPGKKFDAKNIADSITNTHRIDWQTSDGKPYALTGPTVNNGEAYVAKLQAAPGHRPEDRALGHAPVVVAGRQRLRLPADQGPQPRHRPAPARQVPAGTKVTLTFKSRWQIEWDFDYGFVLGSTDGGKTYTSFPSAKGYTTARPRTRTPTTARRSTATGITGSNGSYKSNTQAADRVPATTPRAASSTTSTT